MALTPFSVGLPVAGAAVGACVMGLFVGVGVGLGSAVGVGVGATVVGLAVSCSSSSILSLQTLACMPPPRVMIIFGKQHKTTIE